MRAYINSYESLSCAGDTKDLMRAIDAKETAITIDTSYIKDIPVGLGKMKYDDFYQVLEDVTNSVLENSNLDNFSNTLLIVGSSVGGMKESEEHFFKDKNYKNINPNRHFIGTIADFLASRFNFCDTRSISTACTSSANALLLAKRLINVEAYENILVVGADSLCHTTVCGFQALSVLSSKVCTPFEENREGMNVAEAVAALLVQNKKEENSIEILGVGASSDAYHMTNPDPEAKGAIASMQNALLDANLNAQDIDYINAHGTGTEANDRVESLAIESVFKSVSFSSTKSITGHTLGAAGAIEAIISCESIKRDKNIDKVLSNSFAFGGNNTSLIFGAIK
jgi:3-oxoacyl-[acyl-carrier-protein] synthase I